MIYTLLSCTCHFWGFFPQGIENIRNEIQDTMEPLIDPVHGHGRYRHLCLSSLLAR